MTKPISVAPQTAGGTPARSLPRGPHGIPRDVVRHRQVTRVFAALAIVISEEGYAGLSVKKVIRAAGISSATFYELFANKGELMQAAHAAAFARLLERIEGACATEVDWTSKVRAGIAAAVGFIATEPEAARLLSIDTFASVGDGGSRGLDYRDRLAALLAPGRRQRAGSRLPVLTEQALVAAIWATLSARLLRGELDGLAALQSELVELALAPYIGSKEASQAAVGVEE